MSQHPLARIGVVGLAVMGQNLALNIASKGFVVSVHNRSPDKVDATVKRAHDEQLGSFLFGYKDMQAFVASIAKPRAVLMMIQAGAPVDETIDKLMHCLEPGDLIVDGGNEWYQNTERRSKLVNSKGFLYMGMGVSGGEEGARHGPALMPGGPADAYAILQPVLTKIAAQVADGPCVTHIGPGGAGNYVKMIHNGIEYGDMQLIAESYELLKTIGGLSNEELRAVFSEWNSGELSSFLVQITADVFACKDEDHKSYIVDKILDKTGMKGTGKWTVQEGAEQCVPIPTIAAALDARMLSAMYDERQVAHRTLTGPTEKPPAVDKRQLIQDVRHALYAAKICSYAQGMNLIRTAGVNKNWNLNLSEIARIWKGGCIIRAVFLDRIKGAYSRNAQLPNLLLDPEFAHELGQRHAALRRVVTLAISSGTPLPAFSASLAYYDAYRSARLPANLTQAQRDYFGAHTYERVDKPGRAFHTEWAQLAAPSHL